MYYFRTDSSSFLAVGTEAMTQFESGHVDRPHTNLFGPYLCYFEFISFYSLAFYFMLRKT
jgi:hypothetical protein